MGFFIEFVFFAPLILL